MIFRRCALLVLLVLTATACASGLDRQNFPRATVPEPVPAGEVDDPAVSPAALRTVDTCAVLRGAAATVGTPAAGWGSVEGFGECGAEVTDAGGKTIRLNLRLAASLLTETAPGSAVEGLPLIVEEVDETCYARVITSRTDLTAIEVQASYEDSDACDPADRVAHDVIEQIHDSPAQLSRLDGSLVTVDPCATVDAAVTVEVFGRGGEERPSGLHSCAWHGSTADGTVRLDNTYLPREPDSGVRIDLGGGVTGYQELDTSGGQRCEITWTHLPVSPDQGEAASVEYDNYHEDAGPDDPCGKARRLVGTILPKLPKS
ncbi:DUF3558 domain-containing protein [Amycolatopsis endophytica]